MAKDCRAYNKGIHKESNQFPRSKIGGRYSNTFTKKKYAPIFMFRTKCFTCHNIGHLDRDCKLKWVPRQFDESSIKQEKSHKSLEEEVGCTKRTC